MGIFSIIAGPILGLAKDFTTTRKMKREAQMKLMLMEAEAKGKLALAKAELVANQATHSANWEITQAQQAANSWKDEFLTVLLFTPVLLTFVTIVIAAVPGTESIIMRMREATDVSWDQLNKAPEWYRYLLFAAASAVFGLRLTDRFGGKK